MEESGAAQELSLTLCLHHSLTPCLHHLQRGCAVAITRAAPCASPTGTGTAAIGEAGGRLC